MKSARCVVVTFVAICGFGSFRAQVTASSAEGADAFVDQQFRAPAESHSVAEEAALSDWLATDGGQSP